MMQTIQRQLTKVIEVYLGKYPVVAVTGPRQSGKTTMLQSQFPDYTYLSLENPDLREFAETDPNGFFIQYPGKLLLDEVQRVPKLFSYLQTIVDKSREMGQYILSGSQNFQLLQSITQSLAGRVALFKLLPLDFTEMGNAGILPDNFEPVTVQGFYPAIYHRQIPRGPFFENYIQTYVERDISEVLQVRDTSLFRKFLALCATRAGQLLNLNALAGECGISQPTARAWLSVLQSSYIIFLLQPYYTNIGKRLIKTPKLYFYDTGLLAHLLHIGDAKDVPLHPAKGSLFENLIIAEIEKQNQHRYLLRRLWFWREASGREIDLILQNGTQFNAIEIKATQTITNALFRNLDAFAVADKSAEVLKTLMYAGHENQQRSIAQVLGWQGIEALLGAK